MEIRIETDGYASGTRVWLNGEPLERVKEFKFSVAVSHIMDGRRVGGNAKMQYVSENPKGRMVPQEFFGGGFEKFDEGEMWKGTGSIGESKAD